MLVSFASCAVVSSRGTFTSSLTGISLLGLMPYWLRRVSLVGVSHAEPCIT